MAAASNSNANTTVLITGASRGIGLGLAEVYAKKGFRVIATARTPATANDLNALAKAHSATVTVVALDVADHKSVGGLTAALAAAKVTSVDVLINNAGIASGVPGVGLPTLDKESVENFLTIFRTNVVGVWDVTNVLLPLLRASKAAGGAKVINVSSIMGSMSATNDGPWPGLAAGYRVSKTALNELSAVQAREYNVASVTASASADAKAKAEAAPLITVVALHPGWVETDMGKGAGKPPTTVLQSVTGIENVIASVKPNSKTQYLDFENKPLAW